MEKYFRNETNGHTESISNLSILYAILFGVFYFAVRGLWTHVLIQIITIVFCLSTMGGAGSIPILIMHVIYAFLAPGLIESQYFRIGWRAVASPDWRPTSDLDELRREAATDRHSTVVAPPSQKPAAELRAPGNGFSAADEIAKLVALKDAGALTQAEFDAAKAKALSR